MADEPSLMLPTGGTPTPSIALTGNTGRRGLAMPTHDTRTLKTPRIVPFAVWLTFFNTWVLFEETIVDRYGLWEYMPYYRVAQLCSWDIGVLALIVWSTYWVFRRRRT